jgi:hypothetical protein
MHAYWDEDMKFVSFLFAVILIGSFKLVLKLLYFLASVELIRCIHIGMKCVFLLFTCHTNWQFENRQHVGDVYVNSF